uniref:Galactose mutarotase n=1 Tax=Lygus hesperus TaxID=30085 RepID=A0A0A9YJ29_LYGHE
MEAVKITKSVYGDIVLPIIGQTKIWKYTMCNGFMSVEIMNYGATILAINVPNSDGTKENVILGYDDIIGYLNMRNPYLGATIGRYGHRIAGAAFVLRDQTYYLSKNKGYHTYHGGVQGFDKKVWSSRIEEMSVVMTYRSYDLEEGFPGDLCVSARFILTSQNQLIVVYKAIPSNITTPVNIMNQIYFNLSGDPTSNVMQHDLKVFSEYQAVLQEDEPIPTGETEELKDTIFEFKKYTTIADIMSPKRESTIGDEGGKVEEVNSIRTEKDVASDERTQMSVSPCPYKGVYYCIEGLGVRSHAKLKHEQSGRSIQIFSDQPCLFLSFGQELLDAPASRGKWGTNAGILLQTGNFPDAVHHDKFPSPWIQPRKTYQHTIVYKFRVSKLDCSDEEDGEPKPKEVSEEEARMKCFTIKQENNDSAIPEDVKGGKRDAYRHL